jgi:hypothetical protein
MGDAPWLGLIDTGHPDSARASLRALPDTWEQAMFGRDRRQERREERREARDGGGEVTR